MGLIPITEKDMTETLPDDTSFLVVIPTTDESGKKTFSLKRSNLKSLIQVLSDAGIIDADAIAQTAEEAKETAEEAKETAEEAKETAEEAKSTAEEALKAEIPDDSITNDMLKEDYATKLLLNGEELTSVNNQITLNAPYLIPVGFVFDEIEESEKTVETTEETE